MSDRETPKRLTYKQAFRIVAWKSCVFAEQRWHLGPQYYCPTCELPERDLAQGCPACPLTELFQNSYKQDAVQEIERRGGFPEGYTIERLMESYSFVSQVLGDNDDKVDKNWDVQFTELARIVLQERAQHRYINDWNDYQERKSKK